MSLETPSASLRKDPAAAATRTTPDDPDANPQHARRWWILAVLGIAQLMVVLDATVVNIALPHAQASLGFSDADRQWIVTAYSLAFGSLLLIGGRIADIVGRRRTLLIGAAGFAIASAVGGAAQNFGMLAAARAVQGGFGALLAPAILALLTTTFTDPKERAKAFGIFGAIAGAGASIGLLLGGVLTEYLNWRWTLYVNLFFAVIALIGGSALLARHNKSDERQHLDVPGTVLVTLGLFALVYGFSHAAPPTPAASARWGDPVTIVSLILAGVLLVAFGVLERRVRGPLLPLRIITDRNRGGSFLAMFIASVGMFGVFLFLTYYLEALRGYSAVKTGLGFLPMTGMIIVVASVGSTLLVTRVSPRILIPVGMAVAAVGMWMLTNVTLTGSYAATILPATMVIGVGMGFVFAPAFSLATWGVEARDSGVASAAVNAMQQVGGAIGTALLNTISGTALTSYLASHHGPLAQAHASLHSYVVPFWVATGIFVGGAVLTAVVLRSGVPQQNPDAEPAVVL
jgi:EmrB/QacA subfamily drug resistance transporter